jgi:hypothetical protein
VNSHSDVRRLPPKGVISAHNSRAIAAISSPIASGSVRSLGLLDRASHGSDVTVREDPPRAITRSRGPIVGPNQAARSARSAKPDQ